MFMQLNNVIIDYYRWLTIIFYQEIKRLKIQLQKVYKYFIENQILFNTLKWIKCQQIWDQSTFKKLCLRFNMFSCGEWISFPCSVMNRFSTIWLEELLIQWNSYSFSIPFPFILSLFLGQPDLTCQPVYCLNINKKIFLY